MEMLGIDPRTFHMQSERSITELHPLPEKILLQNDRLASCNEHSVTSTSLIGCLHVMNTA